ncbi:hypothetical protein HPT27_16390 [Permianibacter sp. IMCC34836]|uniref:hypothetical protein n=1 Tax=Permianibacter fluminis TaxID=2738515 RepID=UPI001555CC43|nr:hypothetical protein [Permianibacter fluminis]NQD38604.1 hypothetical protein [Permianibacter fluminis]
MPTRLLLLIGLLFSANAMATKVETKSIDDVVERADYVIVATVVSVDLVNAQGSIVNDPEARTGEGDGNVIRLHVDTQEVLFPADADVPKRIVIELWPMWHYTLGQIKEEELGNTGFFLLKGPKFEPAYPAFFHPSLDRRSEVMQAVERRLEKTLRK